MNKKLMCLSALALSVTMSQATLACGDHLQGFSGERLEKITAKLDLNADQKAKIKAIRMKSREALHPKFEEVRSIRHQINEVFAETSPSERKLDALVHQEKETLGAIIKIRVTERREISNVLTPQQKAKFSELVQQWEKKHEEKRHAEHEHN